MRRLRGLPRLDVARGVIFTLSGAFWLSRGIWGSGRDLLLVIGGAGMLLSGAAFLVGAFRNRRPSDEQE